MYCFKFVQQSLVCTAYGISFFTSALPSALVVNIICYLVFPIILVGAYLTLPKAVVLILKHATSLRHSMLPGPALIQVDLDCQTADVDKKINQHVMASQGLSADIDEAFIMAIEMVRLYLRLFKPYQAFISNFRCDKCVHKRIVFWNRHSYT